MVVKLGKDLEAFKKLRMEAWEPMEDKLRNLEVSACVYDPLISCLDSLVRKAMRDVVLTGKVNSLVRQIREGIKFQRWLRGQLSPVQVPVIQGSFGWSINTSARLRGLLDEVLNVGNAGKEE